VSACVNLVAESAPLNRPSSQIAQLRLTLAPPPAPDASAAAARAAFGPGGPFTAMSEPALLLGRRGVLATNAAGESVAEDAAALAEIMRVAEAAASAKTAVRRILPALNAGRRVLLEFDVAPWGAGRALALGRDVTIQTGVREALEFSRERYRALLEIAVDCIWETGPDGAIDLLAPNVVFGRSAATLIGQPLPTLIACKAPGFYRAREPQTWLRAGLIALDGGVVLGAAIIEPAIEPETGRILGYRGCFRQTAAGAPAA